MLVKKMPRSIQRENLRTGPASEHLQDPIPQSSYHARLDAGEDEEDEDDLDVEMDEGEHDSVPDLTSSICFWSDYSCVFYHPRGLHRIPDPAEWEREAGWPQGVERFHAYDTNQAVLEDSFRLFAEECHLLQLNWRGNTPFVALSGAFPVTPSPPALEILIRLFTPCLTAQGQEFSAVCTAGCVPGPTRTREGGCPELGCGCTIRVAGALPYQVILVHVPAATAWTAQGLRAAAACAGSSRGCRPFKFHSRSPLKFLYHLSQHFFSSPPLPLSPIDVPVHCTHPPPFHALPLTLLSASTAGSRGVKQHTPCMRWYLGPSQDHVYTWLTLISATAKSAVLSRIRRLCSCCTSLVQLSNPQLPAIMLLESQEPSHATSYATSNSSELAVGSDMGRSGRGEQPACFQDAGKAVERLLR
ncbi:hypothetical protein JB92DRAFT_2832749 [Gautieria morchelliformis]|nr:hypothetical protein JB92DRAFT_2832749 [Gautieria morchelliformis]